MTKIAIKDKAFRQALKNWAAQDKKDNSFSIDFDENGVPVVKDDGVSLEEIQVLKLQNSGIKNLEGIGNFKNVWYVDLRDNQISKLPKDISKLVNIFSIKLDGNKLWELNENISYDSYIFKTYENMVKKSDDYLTVKTHWDKKKVTFGVGKTRLRAVMNAGCIKGDGLGDTYKIEFDENDDVVVHSIQEGKRLWKIKDDLSVFGLLRKLEANGQGIQNLEDLNKLMIEVPERKVGKNDTPKKHNLSRIMFKDNNIGPEWLKPIVKTYRYLKEVDLRGNNLKNVKIGWKVIDLNKRITTGVYDNDKNKINHIIRTRWVDTVDGFEWRDYTA